jgi:hypothetical protein
MYDRAFIRQSWPYFFSRLVKHCSPTLRLSRRPRMAFRLTARKIDEKDAIGPSAASGFWARVGRACSQQRCLDNLTRSFYRTTTRNGSAPRYSVDAYGTAHEFYFHHKRQRLQAHLCSPHDKLLREIDGEAQKLRGLQNSRSYRLGRGLLAPARLLRKLWRRLC